MYLLIVTFSNGDDDDYIGPFKTSERAEIYALACKREFEYYKAHAVKPLTVPHNSFHMALEVSK